jgi:hypothetical protein
MLFGSMATGMADVPMQQTPLRRSGRQLLRHDYEHERYLLSLRRMAIHPQNRITSFGEIVAISQRGMFTGNRGIIHDPVQRPC